MPDDFIQIEIDKIEAKIAEAEALLGTELNEEAEREIGVLKSQISELVRTKDSPTHRSRENSQENFNNVIIEVRQGVGGDEAKIWAEDLLRMYSRWANFNNLAFEQLDSGVIKIKGKNLYSKLKWETGVHRVQRVPETEASGRIHTSTASVVILPEVPESRVEIKEDDLGWEFTRAGGHGGQNVNKVASAVRLTHKPSGIIISCRQERSQQQNRKVALEMLRGELWEREEERKLSIVSHQRSAIGRSMRAEKIRTYNYPQNRVTDHRIGKSWYQLETIVEGRLDEVLATLSSFDFSQINPQNDDKTAEDE